MKKTIPLALFLVSAAAFNGYSQTTISKAKTVLAQKPALSAIKSTTPAVVGKSDTTTPAVVANTEPPVVNTAMTRAYNNYDFVAGDTVVFEDHFEDDQNGEFASHWNLGAGQAVMNTVGAQKALFLTQGNFVHVSPLIKTPVYFADAFTLEFDWYFNGSYGPHIYFYSDTKAAKAASGDLGQLSLDHEAAEVTVESASIDLAAPFADDVKGEDHYNNWHHIAIAYKKNQLKVYVDQNRVLVVPNLGIQPHAFDVEGIGDDAKPIVLANFRVARGAGMNMLGKKFTDAKIVTHGINFDVDKATLRPESMGAINMIAAILKDNPDVKFEVDGHTDNSGATAHNLLLSQQRAEAVRAQLISMGVDASRLTAKGFGDTKPMADNKTPEGKANNRRVEFVKK